MPKYTIWWWMFLVQVPWFASLLRPSPPPPSLVTFSLHKLIIPMGDFQAKLPKTISLSRTRFFSRLPNHSTRCICFPFSNCLIMLTLTHDSTRTPNCFRFRAYCSTSIKCALFYFVDFLFRCFTHSSINLTFSTLFSGDFFLVLLTNVKREYLEQILSLLKIDSVPFDERNNNNNGEREKKNRANIQNDLFTSFTTLRMKEAGSTNWKPRI